jgi:hypothetical protein
VAGRDGRPQEQRHGERDQDRQAVPVADGVAQPRCGVLEHLRGLVLAEQAGEEALEEREHGDRDQPEGEPVAPPGRVSRPGDGHDQRGDRHVHEHPPALEERALGRGSPQPGERGEHRERAKQPDGEQRGARHARPWGEAERGREEQPPPHDDARDAAGLERGAPVVQRDHHEEQREDGRHDTCGGRHAAAAYMRRYAAEGVTRSAPLIALFALVGLLVPGAAAAAGPGESSDSPSLNQYTESVPTSRGDRRTQGGPRERPVPLPSSVRRDLEREAGPDAQALDAIATEPALGAPGRGARDKASERSSLPPSDAADPPSAIGAAAEATGSSAVAPLALALLAMLALAAGVALMRRRAQPR